MFVIIPMAMGMAMAMSMAMRMSVRMTMRMVIIMFVAMVMIMMMAMIIFSAMMDNLFGARPARILAKDERFDGDRHSERGNAHFAKINVIKVHQHDAIDDQNLACDI